MNELSIEPFSHPALGPARVPGSKSISNRALLLAFLCDEEVTIRNLLHSQDTDVLRESFFRLGIAPSETEDGSIRINGCAGRPPNESASLYVANAGTVARFLPSVLSLLPAGEYSFDGSEAMRKRPMAGLLESLVELGAQIDPKDTPGYFPFRLLPRGWRSSHLEVDASRSSQILSGLLIAATRAPHTMHLHLAGETVSKPFVEMTLRMIGQFGGKAKRRNTDFQIEPGLHGPEGGVYQIEPDASAASYFFALPLAVGGSCSVGRFPTDSLQGDLEFVDVLEKIGLSRNESEGVITLKKEETLSSVDIDFNAFSDTFLTLAALAPLLPGPTRIRGIGHTRHQETDRIKAMTTELRKLGQIVEDTEDSLTIRPDRAAMISRTSQAPLSIETYEDHRVAMSFGILGSHDLHGDQRPWIRIRDPECCRKTFPKFFEELAHLSSVAKTRKPIHD